MTMAAEPRTESPFAGVEEAIEEIRAGRFVVVVDDEDRENEGDLTIAAQFATPEAVNFMVTHARGLVCLCLTEERCDELGLRQMTDQNETPFGTAPSPSRSRRARASRPASRRTTAPTRSRSRSTPHRRRATSSIRHIFPLRARRGGGSSAPARPRPRSTLRGWPVDPGRRRLRDHEGRRDDGPRARPRRLLRDARPEDDHRRRPDRVPAPAREARGAGHVLSRRRPPTASSRRSRSARR